MRKHNVKKLRRIVTALLVVSMVSSPALTAEAKTTPKAETKVIVIDPGCQQDPSVSKESVGPGAWTFVEDDMVGATGVVTKTAEYELNLAMAQKVEKLLKNQGYRVQLTRTTNDVDIDNTERSMVANTLGADLYISIHASVASKKQTGMAVVCETADNPYNFGRYRECRLLADTLVGCLSEKTSEVKKEVEETDEVVGINWCAVPNAIVVIGNLNNPDDDEKLNDEEYQDTIAEGIAAGVESYFSQK